jgi:hypothetical protein
VLGDEQAQNGVKDSNNSKTQKLTKLRKLRRNNSFAGEILEKVE